MKCPICGMGYMPGIPDNDREHWKYHDRVVNGISYRRAKSDLIVWEQENLRVALVNQSSSLSQRRRAEETAKLAARDTPFDGLPYYASETLNQWNVHVFMLYCGNRIIGLLVTDRRENVWRCNWTDYNSRKAEKVPVAAPIWSIAMVWIHSRHRRIGLGQLMVTRMTTFLGCDSDSVGWCTEFTESGKALVQKCCPMDFLIAK